MPTKAIFSKEAPQQCKWPNEGNPAAEEGEGRKSALGIAGRKDGSKKNPKKPLTHRAVA